MTRAAVAVLFFSLMACTKPAESPVSSDKAPSQTTASTGRTHRDWDQHPAVIQLNTSEDVYAIGDPHADYERLTAVLAGAKIIASDPARPEGVAWTAGKAVVIFTGDLIDKGTASLQVIALTRALQTAAEKAGGRVVILMGNHEAEFLAKPASEKVSEFAGELKSAGIAAADVAACKGDLGGFLCSLPFAARVNDWFFSHAGNTDGRTMPKLITDLQAGVDRDGYATPELTGANSVLEARLGDDPWFQRNGSNARETLETFTRALGVAHIVQGHQPGHVLFTDQTKRKKGEMFQRYGLIFLEDTGMSKGVNDSQGAVLRIIRGKQKAIGICPDGSEKVLWNSDTHAEIGKMKRCGE